MPPVLAASVVHALQTTMRVARGSSELCQGGRVKCANAGRREAGRGMQAAVRFLYTTPNPSSKPPDASQPSAQQRALAAPAVAALLGNPPRFHAR